MFAESIELTLFFVVVSLFVEIAVFIAVIVRSTVSFNNNDCFIIYILFVSLVRWFAGCLVV